MRHVEESGLLPSGKRPEALGAVVCHCLFSNPLERLPPVVPGCSRRARDPLRSTHLQWPKWHLETSLNPYGFSCLINQEGRGARKSRQQTSTGAWVSSPALHLTSLPPPMDPTHDPLSPPPATRSKHNCHWWAPCWNLFSVSFPALPCCSFKATAQQVMPAQGGGVVCVSSCRRKQHHSRENKTRLDLSRAVCQYCLPGPRELPLAPRDPHSNSGRTRAPGPLLLGQPNPTCADGWLISASSK